MMNFRMLAALVLIFAGSLAAQTIRPFSPEELVLVDKLHSSAGDGERGEAARKMGNLHDDRFLDALSAALADTSEEVRISSVNAIADVWAARSVDIIEAAAGDAAQPDRVRLAASAQLLKLTKTERGVATIKALDRLRHNGEPAISRLAETYLSKAIESADYDILIQFGDSTTKPLKQTIDSEIAARRKSREPAKVVAESTPNAGQVATSTGSSNKTSAFSADDAKTLNAWRETLDGQLSVQMAANGKSAGNLKMHSPGRDRLERINRFLNTARTRLKEMSLPDLGVAVFREEATATRQAQAARFASKASGAAAKTLNDAPGEVRARVDGDTIETYVDHHEEGVLLFSFLSLAAGAQAQDLEQRAAQLQKIQSSLSSDAIAAIEARRADLTAHPKAGGIDPTNPIIPPEDAKIRTTNNQSQPESHPTMKMGKQ